MGASYLKPRMILGLVLLACILGVSLHAGRTLAGALPSSAGLPMVAAFSAPQCGGCDPAIDCCDQFNCTSPIILDLSGNGFFLTDASHGVVFDISGSGNPIHLGWTTPSAENAFLALDRNGNGIIDDGTELFGNFTPQPPSEHPNGFLALAVFDRPENGGNGDGIIDSHDRVFASLRLWIDSNHDGICQPEELYSLSSKGVEAVSLNYHASMKRDQHGNMFRYRAKVNPRDRNDTSDIGRTAYDVFLVAAH